MARTAITGSNAPGSYVSVMPLVTQTAADTGNQNDIVPSGKDLVLVFSAGSHTFTLTGAANASGRTGNIGPVSMTVGQFRAFGPISALKGWMQTGRKLFMEGNHAEIKIAVIRLP